MASECTEESSHLTYMSAGEEERSPLSAQLPAQVATFPQIFSISCSFAGNSIMIFTTPGIK